MDRVLPMTPVAGQSGPELTGGHTVHLLDGGDQLFAAMRAAIATAHRQVWLATYIFHDDESARGVAHALADAAKRGVRVNVVVDGFGSKSSLATLRGWLDGDDVHLAVFRPIDRWWRLLYPGQLRRLHQKLCVVDRAVAFVGGINVIDDRNDINHGWSDTPRLDFAVEVRGPMVEAIERAARAMWARAAFGAEWRDEIRTLARSAEPVARARRLLGRLRIAPSTSTDNDLEPQPQPQPPMLAAFVVRDNLRQRRAIERAYIDAIHGARRRVEIMCPYFYPGRIFRRALRRAAARGVQVRLLLQGKVDYRFAALAAQVLYDELLASGVQIYEYTPAFLHAKVALVDDDWATVGSSNIDPLSLLLNLEANVFVQDAGFTATLAARFEAALANSRAILRPPAGRGWWSVLQRGFVAWTAYWFLRLAGMSGRY
jgi:cardiolipin synthase